MIDVDFFGLDCGVVVLFVVKFFGFGFLGHRFGSSHSLDGGIIESVVRRRVYRGRGRGEQEAMCVFDAIPQLTVDS
jgi:hypothetical protein